ncbi:MAG TPA: SRPBCC family protein [Methylococcaceae bacterium]|nr:SRPBCC family protein [Methylococcaceae bacterium]
MKRFLTLIALMMFAWVGVANAHGPSRQKLTETVEINAAPAKVWNIIKDFGNAHAWMPMVASTTSQGGNAAGATRELTLKKGGVIKEELTGYEAEKMSYKYKISENPDCAVLPVNNYTSNIAVEASGSGSKVTWNGAYYRCFLQNNPPPDQNEEAANKAVTAIYKESLANLKALAEK